MAGNGQDVRFLLLLGHVVLIIQFDRRVYCDQSV